MCNLDSAIMSGQTPYAPAIPEILREVFEYSEYGFQTLCSANQVNKARSEEMPQYLIARSRRGLLRTSRVTARASPPVLC